MKSPPSLMPILDTLISIETSTLTPNNVKKYKKTSSFYLIAFYFHRKREHLKHKEKFMRNNNLLLDYSICLCTSLDK